MDILIIIITAIGIVALARIIGNQLDRDDDKWDRE